MEKKQTVLVVGATGFLGTEICRQLVQANKSVKGLVRSTSDPLKIKSLQDLGVETVTGDLKDRPSLANALENIDAVISTASSTLSRAEGDSIDTVDRMGQLNLVEAAEERSVQHFVYVSFLESPEESPLQDAKRSVESRLKTSGMKYTILRPTFFTEVWLSPNLGFDAANHSATVYGHGVNKISWISLQDVATFAVLSIEKEEAVNRTFDLGGPEALSPLEVIRMFESESGSSFTIQYVPEEGLRMQKEAAVDPLQRSFAALMLTYASGAEVPMEETLKALPAKLRTVADYCHVVAGMPAATEAV
jgi:uncharacterized protein YbjT (DUF2867 family)